MPWTKYNINGLVQDCSNSIADAPELLQSCTKPSILSYLIYLIYIISDRDLSYTVKCRYNAVQFITILYTALQECVSDFRITKDTPYHSLMGDLWGVFCADLGENWPHYNGTLLTVYVKVPFPCSVLTLTFDWLNTVKYRSVSHVWRHQHEI